MSVGEKGPKTFTADRILDRPDCCDRCGNLLGRRSRVLSIKAFSHRGVMTDGSQYMLCPGCSNRMGRWLEELKGESS